MSFEQELQTNQGSPITLRGFLYPAADGGWVLSDEPGLKSCCVGSASKVMRQVYLEGDFVGSTPGVVVAVNGELQVTPQYSESGDLMRYYTMKDASVEAFPSPSPSWALLLLLPITAAVLLLRHKNIFTFLTKYM